MKRFSKIIILIIITTLISISLWGCSNNSKRQLQLSANDLMYGITARQVDVAALSDEFIASKADFSISLFRKTLQEDENTLISATSVLLALAMTANGASGETLSQMEAVLGGGLPIIELNRYLYSFASGLFSGDRSRLDIANSIWFREDGIVVNPEFLQTNADYFGANAYSAPFDQTTVEDINAWVHYHTDGMIEEILEVISPETVMYLINAIMFDAEWARIYERRDIRSGHFTAFDNREQTVSFMRSTESLFINDDLATGFIKPYHGNHYSFVALLPNEGVCVLEYVNSLTGADFVSTIQNAQNLSVVAALPKFEFEFDLSLVDALVNMGMVDAFCDSDANLTGLGQSFGNLFISDVMHNTFISVGERGTRAGAVTSVAVDGESVSMLDRYVILNSPFVFAIIDNAVSLPIFMGTVLEV